MRAPCASYIVTVVHTCTVSVNSLWWRGGGGAVIGSFGGSATGSCITVGRRASRGRGVRPFASSTCRCDHAADLASLPATALERSRAAKAGSAFASIDSGESYSAGRDRTARRPVDRLSLAERDSQFRDTACPHPGEFSSTSTSVIG
jgi:hypothetical protein